MSVKIAPSILSADFSKLGSEVRAVDQAGADYIHVDVMDGHFVPNITIGPVVVSSIRPYTSKPLDVHLMIDPPDPYIEAFADAGADIITVHKEAGTQVEKTLQKIKSLGVRAGLSVNPETPPESIANLISKVDLILIMTVNPGFGGQSFMDSQLEKISIIKEMIIGFSVEIEVDGGINSITARKCIEAGADVLVAGNAIFNSGTDYKKSISELRA